MLPVPPRTRAGVTKIPEPMVLFSTRHMTVNRPSKLLPVGLLSVLRWALSSTTLSLWNEGLDDASDMVAVELRSLGCTATR